METEKSVEYEFIDNGPIEWVCYSSDIVNFKAKEARFFLGEESALKVHALVGEIRVLSKKENVSDEEQQLVANKISQLEKRENAYLNIIIEIDLELKEALREA